MELTIDQALKMGIEAHKAGQLQEADRLYRVILKAQPKHPDANHNMGVLAVGVGKVQEAMPFFKTALEASPNVVQFSLSYIDALIKLEKFEDAKDVFRQAKIKGAKGDEFDKLEHRLKGLDDASSELQSAPQEQVESLLILYNQGQLVATVEQAQTLTEQYPEAFIVWNILGAAASQIGKLDQAVLAFHKVIKMKPDYADAHNNLGNALKDQGKWEEAIEAYKKALAMKPGYADAYGNLGNVLYEQGKLKDATIAYNKALLFKPDSAETFNNMGNALYGQRSLDKALEAYNKALALKPDYAEAYYNRGIVFREQGKLEKAIEDYSKALTIRPNYAEALNNMGLAFKEKGKFEKAIVAYCQALEINPHYAEAFNNISVVLQQITFTKPNPNLLSLINLILDHRTYVRPKDISPAAISLLKLEPRFQKLFQKYSTKLQREALKNVILALSEFPLLLKLMSVSPLADLELEQKLNDIRSDLLFSISEMSKISSVLQFQSALALQCFTNEYVYNYNKAETQALQKLELEVAKSFSIGQQPNPQSVLCLASYKALHEYEWCDLLASTSDIAEVFKRQIIEPKTEASLKPDIPVLKAVTDKVSAKVKEQYEGNPYPRWVNLGLNLKPVPISIRIDEMKLKLADFKIRKIDAPNILIAGCGTGQHSIGTASRFQNSKVLAVDLSLSSLAYAKRKTKELGVVNIEYMQADILDLAKLGKQFDIVESAGVLHHMDDPMAGWRVLTDCLKKGGLMNIGLYSDLARQDVVKIRNEINMSGIRSTNAEMTSFRHELKNSIEDHHKSIIRSHDFYSLSELRDLLFHVQEHRFTLSQIKDCLYRLSLNFCGFEEDKLTKDFKLSNTGADDLYDLDKWKAYEEANPHTFAGMYQFWCQKV